MTFSEALESPALHLLLWLEADGFDLATDDDRLWVTPTVQLTAEARTAIAEQRIALHCRRSILHRRSGRMTSLPRASRLLGRGRLLQSLRVLIPLTERFGVHHAATPDERQWAGRFVDGFERLVGESGTSGSPAGLEAVERRAALSRKLSPSNGR